MSSQCGGQGFDPPRPPANDVVIDLDSAYVRDRPKRSAHDAIQRVAEAILTNKTEVIDLDFRTYFDTVRHHLLLEKVAKRVDDDAVMALRFSRFRVLARA